MDAVAPPAVVTESHPSAEAAPFEPEPAPQAHAVDLGLATFLRSGIASSGVIGLSPFVTDELGQNVLVRIAGAIGQAPRSGLQLTWVAGRLDTCEEALGNYAAGSGLRLDLCGGADVGATFIASLSTSPAQSLPFVDIGPSVDLRAEMGTSAAFLLRAGVGLSIARDRFIDATGASYQPPPATVDLEVALSWTLPGGGPASTPAAGAGPR